MAKSDPKLVKQGQRTAANAAALRDAERRVRESLKPKSGGSK